MKTTIHFLLGFALATAAYGEFRTWTRSDGKTAELDLVSVTEADGEKTGEFKMRNGKSVKLKASVLADADAKLVADWKPAAAVPAAVPSVFDKALDGNLLKLEGKSLKRFTPVSRPKKYYVFYYTASWCGPCQQFTPSLVEFYEQKKNDNFEIVLITSDQDEAAMENYAVQKKMPWPQLKLKDVAAFKKDFNHGVTGIPSVIVCELDGKKLGNYRNLAELENLVK
jgi:thiol-disulfide isomerase/thioredoxin